MTATIEPRLIHLLNESTTPQISSADLPPLTSLSHLKETDLSLPPIEGDASFRADRNGIDAPPYSHNPAPVHLANDDVSPSHLRDESHRNEIAATPTRAYPFHLLVNETAYDPIDHPPSSLSKILDDTTASVEDVTNKKRARMPGHKDDFMQLPQPLKKQKAAPQTHVMPPIINGLHEPPPHRSLFPPIDSTTFSGASNPARLPAMNEWKPVMSGSAEMEKIKWELKNRKRATKPRSKWSEEETKHLLLGVSKHGVGKWKHILEDKDFSFNSRTAGDLKDRFRTCCPDELRDSGKASQTASKQVDITAASKCTKKRNDLDRILINVEELHESGAQDDRAQGNDGGLDPTPPPKKSRAHRKKMQDLAELGIHAPFRPSGRRERRPFTDEEDRKILEGLEIYGPAWTKIQRDPRFNLSYRQPTDLRDRIRNGHPQIFQQIEKGAFQAKGSATRGNDVMEPSVVTSISNGLERPSASVLESQANRTSSREDLPRWPLQMLESVDGLMLHQGLEGADSTGQAMGGEMDISRLLLDDSNLA